MGNLSYHNGFSIPPFSGKRGGKKRKKNRNYEDALNLSFFFSNMYIFHLNEHTHSYNTTKDMISYKHSKKKHAPPIFPPVSIRILPTTPPQPSPLIPNPIPPTLLAPRKEKKTKKAQEFRFGGGGYIKSASFNRKKDEISIPQSFPPPFLFLSIGVRSINTCLLVIKTSSKWRAMTSPCSTVGKDAETNYLFPGSPISTLIP